MPWYIFVFIVLTAFLFGYVLILGIRTGFLLHVSKEVQSKAIPFSKEGKGFQLAVLGDSTAVGVGAESRESVAGRLATAIGAGAVFNVAESGATSKDLIHQVTLLPNIEFDLVLIQIGANDIIRFRNLDETRKNLVQALGQLHASRIVLLTAGDIGNAPFFPWPLSVIYTKRTKLLRNHFMEVAQAHKVAYVDLFILPDVFGQDPKRYYSADMLHLSEEGYAIWYTAVESVIHDRWPEVYGNNSSR